MDELTKLTNKIRKMITEMKNKSGCKVCMNNVIEALIKIKNEEIKNINVMNLMWK